MLPAMAISLIRGFYGAIVHEMEQHHSGTVVTMLIHLSSRVDLASYCLTIPTYK